MRSAIEDCITSAPLPEQLGAEALTATVPAKRVAWALFAVVVSLHLLNAFVQVLKLSTGSFRGKDDLVELFAVNDEGRLPTWYSVMTLMACGVLAAVIAFASKRSNGPSTLRWSGLAIIFTAMSFDESAEVHDRVGTLVERLVDVGGGILHFAWVLGGLAFVIVFAAVYLRFVLGLPNHTRMALAMGGVIYVSGALGMEMVNGVIADRFGHAGGLYAIGSSFEEFLEMSGIVLVIYALCRHLGATTREITLRLR